MDLDLAGIGELGLDLLGDVPGQQGHLILADLLGLDHDADLAARLDGVAAGDAREGPGHGLQLLQALDIVLANDEKLLAYLEARREENKKNPKKMSGLAARLQAMQQQQMELQKKREELARKNAALRK